LVARKSDIPSRFAGPGAPNGWEAYRSGELSIPAGRTLIDQGPSFGLAATVTRASPYPASGAAVTPIRHEPATTAAPPHPESRSKPPGCLAESAVAGRPVQCQDRPARRRSDWRQDPRDLRPDLTGCGVTLHQRLSATAQRCLNLRAYRINYAGRPISLPAIEFLPVIFPFRINERLPHILSTISTLELRTEGHNKQTVDLR